MDVLSWVFKRNWGLITIVTVGAVFVGLIASLFIIPPVYQAKAILMVAGTGDPAVTKLDYMTVLANKQLVKTYTEIVPSMSVLKEVAIELPFPVTRQELKNVMVVNQVGDTELMEIAVSWGDPAKAAQIANYTAEVFSHQVETIYPLATVKLVDPAIENNLPVKPKVLINTLLLGLVGFILSAFWCLAVFYWRQPVEEKEIKGLMGSTLGKISLVKSMKKSSLTEMLTSATPLQNDFWDLQTLVTHSTETGKTLLVTSSVAGEGKSIICMGLALTMAQCGYKVVIVDANLKNPAQAELFQLNSEPGLGNLSSPQSLEITPRDTPYQGLRVITAGCGVNNRYRLLSSPQFKDFMAKTASQADLVIIDSPALLESAEAVTLAIRADYVLMVARAGLPRDELTAAVQKLQTVKANLLGIVLNKT